MKKITKESFNRLYRESKKVLAEDKIGDILSNAGGKYEILAMAGANRLLKRQSDGCNVIAHGWDGSSWMSGKYYGDDKAAADRDWKKYSQPGSFGYYLNESEASKTVDSISWKKFSYKDKNGLEVESIAIDEYSALSDISYRLGNETLQSLKFKGVSVPSVDEVKNSYSSRVGKVVETKTINESEDDSLVIQISAYDPDSQLEALLKCIGDTASPGHSFNVVVDPGDPDHEKSFFMDGDGSFRILTVDVQSTESFNDSEV